MEIMSPVGSDESLVAALQAGAQSVYFGVGKLNMRSRSSVNFTGDDLQRIADTCRAAGVKMYLTLNTIIYDDELAEMKSLVDAARSAGITAIIASDLSVMEYCRHQGVEVHTSTQCNITNTEAVAFYARYADVVVLARELNLTQVAVIARNIREQNICGPSGQPIQLEVFAHGALCMAVSGKCYLSLDLFNQSANRGACYQPCRRGYTVRDKENEVELDIDQEYIMSPKDLCTIGFLDKIRDAGVSILKIEGRGRSADYVFTTTQCYREAIESLVEDSYTPERIKSWETRLKSVYNRGFWDGYYLGRKIGEWSETYGSRATTRKTFIGRVTNYFARPAVAEIHIDTYDLHTGDDLLITGPTTGVVPFRAGEVRVDDKTVDSAVKGDDCSVPVPQPVRRGDKVYKIVSTLGATLMMVLMLLFNACTPANDPGAQAYFDRIMDLTGDVLLQEEQWIALLNEGMLKRHPNAVGAIPDTSWDEQELARTYGFFCLQIQRARHELNAAGDYQGDSSLRAAAAALLLAYQQISVSEGRQLTDLVCRQPGDFGESSFAQFDALTQRIDHQLEEPVETFQQACLLFAKNYHFDVALEDSTRLHEPQYPNQ